MASIKQETENIEASLPVSNQDREHSMVDLDRPHLAAIEDNCQIAKKPSTATFIAIFVGTRTIQNSRAQLIFHLVSGLVYRMSNVVRDRKSVV